MAPLPQNNTRRLFIDYTTGDLGGSQEHTFAVRLDDTIVVDDAQQLVAAFLNAVGPLRFADDWRPLRARVQNSGAAFSLPVTLHTDLATFLGTGGVLAAFQEAVEVSWVGRSGISGRRCKLSLYGMVGFTLGTLYRITPGEEANVWVQDSVDILNATSDSFIAIDGTKPLWYPYVNWQFNSYWEAELRS